MSNVHYKHYLVCDINNRIKTRSTALSKGNLRVFMERNPANVILN
jgi:hypothetical protein